MTAAAVPPHEDPASSRQEIDRFRTANPDVERIDVLIPDAQGVLRGLRLSIDALDDLFADGVGFPGSLYATDICGETVEATGLGFEDGDADRPCRPIAGTLAPVPWAERPTGQVMLTMAESDGSPFHACPRTVLQGVLDRFAELDLTPVIGIELEFYLVDQQRDAEGRPQPPMVPGGHHRPNTTQVYGLDDLDDFDAIIDAMMSSCRAQGLAVDCAVSEYAPGQYEINMDHVADALVACDRAVLFKRAIRGVARRHGVAATFMAKPYPDRAGNGLHVHLSLLDKDGRNIFASDDPAGSPSLRHAIGGLMQTMVDCQALLAPHQNSYRRFRANSYVPMAPAWAINNRSTALRIPLSGPAARRVEHRVGGADANPYLAVAAILAGVHCGLTSKADPGAPIQGNAYKQLEPVLTSSWLQAVDTLDGSAVMRDYLSDAFIDVFVAIKRAERDRFSAAVTPLEYDWYLMRA